MATKKFNGENYERLLENFRKHLRDVCKEEFRATCDVSPVLAMQMVQRFKNFDLKKIEIEIWTSDGDIHVTYNGQTEYLNATRMQSKYGNEDYYKIHLPLSDEEYYKMIK